MKKILVFFLGLCVLVFSLPVRTPAAETQGACGAVCPLALSDELDKAAGTQHKSAEKAKDDLPSFYDPDNPYYNGPQEKHYPDIGKIILYAAIGLIILAALIAAGCGIFRKNKTPAAPSQPPAPPQTNEGNAFCTNCGRPIDPSEAFCPFCGAPNQKQ